MIIQSHTLCLERDKIKYTTVFFILLNIWFEKYKFNLKYAKNELL